MADLGAVLEQLKAERAKLEKAIRVLSSLAEKSGGARSGKRRLSPAARAMIAAAQRSEMGEVQGEEGKIVDRVQQKAPALTHGGAASILFTTLA